MRKLKQIEIEADIQADVGNKLKKVLMFDKDYTIDISNATKLVTHQLTDMLTKRGLLTNAEMKDYIEYIIPIVQEIVQETEAGINKLYRVLTEVENSNLEYKFVIMKIIQKQIDDARKLVDEYYDCLKKLESINQLEFKEGITDTDDNNNK